MTAWNISATDILFPLAVMIVWAAIFLGVLATCRFAAHEHDGEAEAQETAVQDALHGYTSHPTLPA
ncbi:MAG TPA: hypothetical protein VF808_09970 [Ktedonobacterales bacterium]